MTEPTKATIRSLRPATDDEWDRIWQACPYATYFQSRDWSEIWCEYRHGEAKPAPLLVEFEDNKQAILPFTVRNVFHGVWKMHEASPAGTYGGWLSTNILGASHEQALCAVIGRRFSNLSWRDNPYCKATATPAGRTTSDFTHTIDVAGLGGDASNIQNRGHRSSLSKAIRSGVSVQYATTVQDWQAYKAMYAASVERWGANATSHYRNELFDILQRRAETDHNIRLWLAVYRDAPIAGALCLSSRNATVYWHGAALQEHFENRPVNLLMTRIIEDTAKSGRRWFDFNPSGGHEGVERFKRGFGAVRMSSAVVSHTSKSLLLTYHASRLYHQLLSWSHN